MLSKTEEEPLTTKTETRPLLYPFEDLTSEQLAKYSGGKINREGNIEYPGAILFLRSGEKGASFIRYKGWKKEGGIIVNTSEDYPCEESIVIVREKETVDIVSVPLNIYPNLVQYFTLNSINPMPNTKKREDTDMEIKQALDLIDIKLKLGF
ncbi:MAG: hypothetical protein A2W22_02295 [Candidatus Levybacteria bacterium RBG_16_35_11]|nr:MAG: hypothetical protein A2W22_02295 [Candidatus Levybacteria bacterium RBG_16_35_11]